MPFSSLSCQIAVDRIASSMANRSNENVQSYLFKNLLLAALGLCCCVGALGGCGERGLRSGCVQAAHCSGGPGFGAQALGRKF